MTQLGHQLCLFGTLGTLAPAHFRKIYLLQNVNLLIGFALDFVYDAEGSLPEFAQNLEVFKFTFAHLN